MTPPAFTSIKTLGCKFLQAFCARHTTVHSLSLVFFGSCHAFDCWHLWWGMQVWALKRYHTSLQSNGCSHYKRMDALFVHPADMSTPDGMHPRRRQGRQHMQLNKLLAQRWAQGFRSMPFASTHPHPNKSLLCLQNVQGVSSFPSFPSFLFPFLFFVLPFQTYLLAKHERRGTAIGMDTDVLKCSCSHIKPTSKQTREVSANTKHNEQRRESRWCVRACSYHTLYYNCFNVPVLATTPHATPALATQTCAAFIFSTKRTLKGEPHCWSLKN